MPIVVVKWRERLFQGEICPGALCEQYLALALLCSSRHSNIVTRHSVLLSATHKMALKQVTINDLKEFAMDQSPAGRVADPAAGGPIR